MSLFPRLLLALLIVISLPGGCGRNSAPASQTVVLYTSVDEPYVQPLMKQFEQKTGIHVMLVTDAEASKSVGLAERLSAERDHPQADVWWDNEVFLSIRLADEKVLQPYRSPAAADIPAKYKDRENRWAGSILRVRVLVSSPKLNAPRVTHLRDLLRSDLKARVAIARPTAGTTGGHVAALYASLGTAKADAFFQGLHANEAVLVGGNSIVAEQVARGDMLAGLCDNDDAASASTEIGKLSTTLPDQDGLGTLAMPCVVALVANAPHVEPGKRLIDFLLSAEVDRAMIDAKFAWCSARDPAGKGKFMEIDYNTVARAMPAAIRQSTAIMDGR